MARHDKTCGHCGDAFATRWKKTLYCEPCQIIRALQWGLSPCNCRTCSTKFWPLKKTYTQCPTCSAETSIGHRPVTECQRCQKRIRTAPGLQNACLHCVTKSQRDRNVYLTYLENELKKKLARKDAP